MKRTFSILFLLILIIPFWGTYTLLTYQIKNAGESVKEEIEEAIRKNNLTRLSFTPEEAMLNLRWTHSHEFEYKGKMYDVVNVERDGKKIHFLCYYHQEETRLRTELSSLITNAMDHNPRENEKQSNLIYFLKNLYYQKISHSDIFAKETGRYFAYVPANELSVALSPPLPPPKRNSTK